MAQKDFYTQVTTWVADMNREYGMSLTVDEPQAKFYGDNGVDIIISPTIQEEALFFTAVFRHQSCVDSYINSVILKMNYILRDSLGGWFAIDPVDNLICWQYLWQEFKSSQFKDFKLILEHLITVVKVLNDNLKSKTSDNFSGEVRTTDTFVTFKP